ncbi:hypothetical protein [Acinetobacter lactucae]|uniref:hypothetical protein n=1 Tax=Acinetobacter lactucae TaxID=1785128 RepID=UPI0034D2E4EB
MLSPVQKLILNDLKSLIEICLSMFKLGIGVGATCLIYYLIKIEYLPNEISLGDGFVVFFLAIVFSFTLLFFILSEIFLGMIIWEILTYFFILLTNSNFRKKLNNKLNKKLKLRNKTSNFLKFKIKKINYIFLLPLLLIPSILFEFSLKGFFWASLIGLTTYLFSLIIYTLSKEYNFFHRFNSHTEKDEEIGFYKGLITQINIKNNENINVIKTSFLLIIFIPIIYGSYFFDIPFKIISSTMNLVSMRKNNTIIYLKKEYAEMILAPNKIKTKNNYYPILKVNILFKGIGKSTYLELKDGKNIKRFEIPNDAILNTVIIKED